MPEIRSCNICHLDATAYEYVSDAKMDCPRCGQYTITSRASKLLGDLTAYEIAKISGWVREHPNVTISEETIPLLKGLQTPTVGEKAEKILRHLVGLEPRPGTVFNLWEGSFNLELEAVGWAVDLEELKFLIHDYLVAEAGFLQKDGGHKISPKGWAYLDSLRRGNTQSDSGFIAMWFNEEIKPAWTAIDAGTRAAGYRPLRIDQKQHNNKIDDEIIAAIRRSKFLVADCTAHRNGVYFEAGFAMGLGFPVIWTCRHDDLRNTHFDTRQYNFIVWEPDKLDQLTDALQQRIEATIGRGPISL